jgi:hypothetical protein
VTVQGGTDLSTLKYLRIEVVKNGATTRDIYYAYVLNGAKKLDQTNPASYTLDPITVGSIFTSIKSGGILTDRSDQVTITGHFMDGREYMLLNTFL